MHIRDQIAKTLFAAIAITAFSIPVFAQNAPPQVSNIEVSLDTDNRIVVFTYDLQDADDDAIEVSLRISDDGGAKYLVPVDAVGGDIGTGVSSGLGKQILWNYDPSLIDTTSGVFLAKIVADDGFQINIQDLVDQVSKDNLEATVRAMEGIRHPETGLEKLEATKTMLESSFNSYNLNVSTQSFTVGNYTGHNIIGRMPGHTEELSTFLVTGHFDTVDDSPGADDNASVTSAVLEAARVLSQYNLSRTVKFVGFDQEEAGLIGSQRYVQTIDTDCEQIEGVINGDLIAYYSDAPNSQTMPLGFDLLYPELAARLEADEFRGNFIANIVNGVSSDFGQAFEDTAAQYVPDLNVITVVVPGNGELTPTFRRSDHAGFWDAGYKALFLSDSAELRNSNYHRPTDTVDTLNFDFMTNVVKTMVGTIAGEAGLMHAGIGFSPSFDFSGNTGGSDFTAVQRLLYAWVSNSAAFKSTVIANNYGATDAEVMLTARRADGDTETVSRQIPANGFLKESAESLFPTLGVGPGYTITLDSDSLSVRGRWVTFNINTPTGNSPSQGVAVALPPPEGKQKAGTSAGDKLLYGFLPLTDSFISAPVVVNVGSETTTADLRFYNEAGEEVGAQSISLDPYLPFAVVTGDIVDVTGDVYMTATSQGGTLTGVVFVFNSAGEPAIGNASVIPTQ